MPLGSWGHGGGHGSPLQGLAVENPMVRGAWRAAIHRDAKSQTRLSDSTQHTGTAGTSIAPTGFQSCGESMCRLWTKSKKEFPLPLQASFSLWLYFS